ncbi:MAG: Crp/Fnr family transcriptional regulator [Marinifilaceae bacterium]|jgi:CRP-like cAMP-binding protein|nr:Crp/Fnr family transcriptional regulator [Marinifilaceae bacterium]
MIITDKEQHSKICNACINSTNSIFKTLSKEEKTNLKKNMIVFSFNKNEEIYKEGDRPEGLMCLASGNVKIFKAGVGGKEQIVRLAKPIGFIGYRALFAQENHIASAVAMTACTICLINSECVHNLLRSNFDFNLQILRALATDLGFSNRRTVTLTQKHIRGRLAESLLVLIDTYGFEKDRKTLDVYISREDIANLSNMTTSNAIRTLSSFASENIIELCGRKIKILDRKILDNISKMG